MLNELKKADLFFWLIVTIPYIGLVFPFVGLFNEDVFLQIITMSLANVAWVTFLVIRRRKNPAQDWREESNRKLRFVFIAVVVAAMLTLMVSTILVAKQPNGEAAWRWVLGGVLGEVVGMSALAFWPGKERSRVDCI